MKTKVDKDPVTSTEPNPKNTAVTKKTEAGEAEGSSTVPNTRKLTRLTVEKWKRNDLAQYEAESWLTYDFEMTKHGKYCTALYCKVCTQFQSSIQNRKHFSRAYIDGSTNFRMSNVISHAKSEMHSVALSLFRAQNCQNEKVQPFQNQPTLNFNLNPTQLEDLKKKFDIYFIVKEELPLAKYEKILNLEKRHGVPLSSVYCNRTAATEFISYQADELQSELSKDIAKANFYSILFDGTTDKSVTEQEAVFVLYFDSDPVEPELSDKGAPMVKVKMGFVSIENIASADAPGVLSGIKRSLDTLGLKELHGTPPTPLGLGGDGCSTNRGEIGGVQAFRYEFPWSIFVWCMAHRLELALKVALSDTYFKEVDEALLRLYYLYEKSPKKLRGLEELHKAYKETFEFQEGSLKPKRASGTRWIVHKLEALKLLVDKFGILMQHIETLSCDNSVKSADQAKLRGYLRKWKTGKLFVYSCFFIDLLQPAAFILYAFQEGNVDAVSVTLALSRTKKSLNTLGTKEANDLPTMKFYLEKVEEEEYQGTKLSGFESAVNDLKKNAGRYVSMVQDAIDCRLVGTDDISAVASILNSEVWDCSSKESMNETILYFLTKFKVPLVQQGLQVTDLEVVEEWNYMLDYACMYLPISCHHYRATWFKIFHVSRASNWKNILLLIRLLFTFPVSNAGVERFFSCLGRVKTSKRSSLCQATLQDYLRILVSGKTLDNYDPTAAVIAWDNAKHRRPNQKQRKKYKQRKTKKTHFKTKGHSISDSSEDSDNELRDGEFVSQSDERDSASGSEDLTLFSGSSDS